MFNDDAGFELVNLQAQRDLNSLVKNDERRHVNRDRTTTIDNDETVTVHGKRTEVVDLDETITIHQNRTEVVDKDESITIHENRKERVDLDETIDIGGNRTETVHKSEQITIKGNRNKTVHGNDTLNVDKNRKENVHKSRSLNVDKNNTELVKMAKSVTVGLAYATQVGTIMNTAVGIMQTEQIGRIKKTFVGKSYSITAGDEFKITVGKSSLVMNADGSIIITGSTIITQAEKENKVIGKDVLINPPGASNSGEDEVDMAIATSTTNSLGSQVEPELKDGEPYPEDAGYEAYDGDPDLGGGGGSCPAFNKVDLNPRTIDAIETIESKLESGNWLQKALGFGTATQIFTMQDMPGAAWNIKNTDWEMLAKAVDGVSDITKRQISNEAEMAIIDLQGEPRGSTKYRNDIKILKAIAEGCGQ